MATRELIAEVKQFIVDNLEYETNAFEPRDLDEVMQWSGANAAVEFGSGISPHMAGAVAGGLSTWLNQREKSFSDELNDLILKRGLTTVEVYNRAQINRQLFSKISSRSDYRPKKLTTLALAIALELTLEQTKAFIAKAGYALTRSSVTDLVVEFFIDRKMYDVMAINEVLYELEEPILGSTTLEDGHGHVNSGKEKGKKHVRVDGARRV